MNQEGIVMDSLFSNDLVIQIKSELIKKGELKYLTSNANISFIDDQLKYFTYFLVQAIKKKDTKILLKILPWMYHTFHAQKFKYDYFLLTYEVVEDILENILDKEVLKSGLNIIKTAKNSHEKIIEDSKHYHSYDADIQNGYQELEEQFKKALLNGDVNGAQNIFKANVKTFEQLSIFYGCVIYPVMVQIGLDWEKGVVSPAQEHLCSSVVLEILSLLYTQIELPRITKGKVVVSTVTNEFHEIGAIMLANTFEADGWDVTYVGCDISDDELLDTISVSKPNILALSVSMPFNLDATSKLIEKVKKNQPNIKVMVGGNAFNTAVVDEESFGADIYLKDIDEALKISNMWYES